MQLKEFKRPKIKPGTHEQARELADTEGKPIWLIYQEAIEAYSSINKANA